MNWKKIESVEQLEAIDELSKSNPVLIFKHSTRCGISMGVYADFEETFRDGIPDNMEVFYLDILMHRNISNTIAEIYKVRHESPQVLIIQNGRCIMNKAHFAINFDELKNFILTETKKAWY